MASKAPRDVRDSAMKDALFKAQARPTLLPRPRRRSSIVQRPHLCASDHMPLGCLGLMTRQARACEGTWVGQGPGSAAGCLCRVGWCATRTGERRFLLSEVSGHTCTGWRASHPEGAALSDLRLKGAVRLGAGACTSRLERQA